MRADASSSPPARFSGHTGPRLLDAPGRPLADRRRGLPNPGGASEWARSRCGQRPVRAVRSRRSSRRRGGTSTSPAAARPGSHAGPASTTLPGGLNESGYLEADSRVAPGAQREVRWANVLASGSGAAGTTFTCGRCTQPGVALDRALRWSGWESSAVRPDLHDSLAWGDERYRTLIGESLSRLRRQERDLRAPPLLETPPSRPRARRRRSHLKGLRRRHLRGRASAPTTTPGCASPARSTGLGFRSMTSARAPCRTGLYFVGVHFLRKRKSSALIGMGEDAGIVARRVALRSGT